MTQFHLVGGTGLGGMKIDEKDKICTFDDILNTNPGSYRKFVENRISYQRELKRIKDLMIE